MPNVYTLPLISILLGMALERVATPPLIVKAKFRKKKGISFFTPNYTNQQFGYMKHKKNHFSTSDQKLPECPRGSKFLWETAIVPVKSGAYRTPSDRKTSITLYKMKQFSFSKREMVRNRKWMTKNE